MALHGISFRSYIDDVQLYIAVSAEDMSPVKRISDGNLDIMDGSMDG